MKKKNILIIIIVAFFLVTSVGYALFSETLTISGTATAIGNFDVGFTSAEVITEHGSTGASWKISDDKNTLELTVPKLEYPGAFAEYKVVVTNLGSIPAILENIEEINLTGNPEVSISHSNLNTQIGKELIQSGTQEFTIKVTWNETSTASAENVRFNIKLNYKQIMV